MDWSWRGLPHLLSGGGDGYIGKGAEAYSNTILGVLMG